METADISIYTQRMFLEQMYIFVPRTFYINLISEKCTSSQFTIQVQTETVQMSKKVTTSSSLANAIQTYAKVANGGKIKLFNVNDPMAAEKQREKKEKRQQKEKQQRKKEKEQKEKEEKEEKEKEEKEQKKKQEQKEKEEKKEKEQKQKEKEEKEEKDKKQKEAMQRGIIRLVELQQKEEKSKQEKEKQEKEKQEKEQKQKEKLEKEKLEKEKLEKEKQEKEKMAKIIELGSKSMMKDVMTIKIPNFSPTSQREPTSQRDPTSQREVTSMLIPFMLKCEMEMDGTSGVLSVSVVRDEKDKIDKQQEKLQKIQEKKKETKKPKDKIAPVKRKANFCNKLSELIQANPTVFTCSNDEIKIAFPEVLKVIPKKWDTFTSQLRSYGFINKRYPGTERVFKHDSFKVGMTDYSNIERKTYQKKAIYSNMPSLESVLPILPSPIPVPMELGKSVASAIVI